MTLSMCTDQVLVATGRIPNGWENFLAARFARHFDQKNPSAEHTLAGPKHAQDQFAGHDTCRLFVLDVSPVIL
jgi:hypothetical protein